MFFNRKWKSPDTGTEAITDLENNLRRADEEKNRIAAVLESLTEGVVVVDQDQRILVANPALIGAFGLRKDHAEGHYFWEVFRDSNINDMIHLGLKERKPFSREYESVLSRKFMNIQVSPVWSGPIFLGVAAVFHDVTPLKELERLRADFVANVSHEFKTPLTSILGFLETLREGAVEDPSARKKFLGIIEDQSQKLYRLIEDLLELSKAESGHQPVAQKAVDVNEMVSRSLELFSHAIQDKKIEIHADIAPKFTVKGDPELLQQVMNNLIDNALKYNKTGGAIFIRAQARSDGSRIEIRDTGIGIPEADRERIFDRFYRVEKSRARESGGTGLGLAIVKSILERHGGGVEALPVESGAAFRITLPG
ncbi:MAG: PAS domain S-box protein [Candidatus Omnitrophica bacterium]|nr:PAS domain S-box protein [Candidatus Omnitrophota bacterium]